MLGEANGSAPAGPRAGGGRGMRGGRGCLWAHIILYWCNVLVALFSSRCREVARAREPITETPRTDMTDRPSHAMGIAAPTRDSLMRRLARVRGQVEGIQRMVDDERYCPDILQQFAAVHSALRAAEKELLANHLERCAAHALGAGGEAAEQVRQELLDLLYRYVR